MYSSPFGGADMMFSIAPVFITIVFIFIGGTIITEMVKGVSRWQKNNESPILDVAAVIVSKRNHVSHHHHNNNGMNHTSSSTTYFVTFQFESSDRLELEVPDDAFGLLVEGDKGKLKFQGTRFLGFERVVE